MRTNEPINVILHLTGAILSIIGLVLLILKEPSNPWKVVSSCIYATTLLLLFASSTLYHFLFNKEGNKLQIFRKFDHLAIYALIAGTYTPFCLITLHGAWGWSLLGVEWGLALAGIIVQSIYIKAPRWLTTTIYALMGWMIIIGLAPLLENLPIKGLYLLLTGGIIYTLGGIIYTIKKPNFSKRFGFHELWHAFVLAGALFQYLAIYLYVI